MRPLTCIAGQPRSRERVRHENEVSVGSRRGRVARRVVWSKFWRANNEWQVCFHKLVDRNNINVTQYGNILVTAYISGRVVWNSPGTHWREGFCVAVWTKSLTRFPIFSISPQDSFREELHLDAFVGQFLLQAYWSGVSSRIHQNSSGSKYVVLCFCVEKQAFDSNLPMFYHRIDSGQSSSWTPQFVSFSLFCAMRGNVEVDSSWHHTTGNFVHYNTGMSCEKVARIGFLGLVYSSFILCAQWKSARNSLCYPILDIPNLGLLPETRTGLVFEFVPFHEVQIRLKFAIFQVTIPLKTLCRLDVSNLAVHINRFVIEDENWTIISPDYRGITL